MHFNNKEGVMYDDTNDTKYDNDLYDKNGSLKPTVKVNSPTSVLGHETIHAFDWMRDQEMYKKRVKDIRLQGSTPYFRNANEQRATTLSSLININLKEDPRNNYYAIGVQTRGVLSNKVKK